MVKSCTSWSIGFLRSVWRRNMLFINYKHPLRYSSLAIYIYIHIHVVTVCICTRILYIYIYIHTCVYLENPRFTERTSTNWERSHRLQHACTIMRHGKFEGYRLQGPAGYKSIHFTEINVQFGYRYFVKVPSLTLWFQGCSNRFT